MPSLARSGVSRGELAAQVRLGDDVDGAGGENAELLVDATLAHGPATLPAVVGTQVAKSSQ